MSQTKKVWSVYVDGNEVNSFYMTKNRALELADEYIEDGYDTVEIMDKVGNCEKVGS